MTSTIASALVTGAGSGIGRAIAVRLSADYELILLDRDRSGLDETVARLDRPARTLVADLSRPWEAAANVEAALAGSTPDLLVNCAGVGWAADSGETSPDRWDTTVAVNLTATFALCQLVLPAMIERRRGVIVNMASAGSLVGLKRRVAYCASKAGVLGLTRAIAADHAAQGIRINAICPGTVESPWIGRMIDGDPDPMATRARMEQRQLDGRMGTPEEVADWVAFVASDRGRFMNGAALVIDGGLTAV